MQDLAPPPDAAIDSPERVDAPPVPVSDVRPSRTALSIVHGTGVLRSTFREEVAATRYFELTPTCLAELLDDAGFSGARVVPHRERVTRSDIECRLPSGKLVMVELAFVLDYDHIWKDLQYIIDPRAEHRLAGFVWLCDEITPANIDRVRFLADRFELVNRIAVIILRAKRLKRETDEARFDVLLRLSGRAAAAPVSAATTDLLGEVSRASTDGTIPSRALARILGASHSWLTERAHLGTLSGRPRLICVRDGEGAPLRGPSGARMFGCTEVETWVADVEAWVQHREGLLAAIPLVASSDPRIGSMWVQANDALVGHGPAKRSTTLKHRLAPVAFRISSSDKGYTLLYTLDAVRALKHGDRSG